MLAYQPLDGYRDSRDAIALPWDELEEQARERGVDVVDLLAELGREPEGPDQPSA
jgi:predicted DNA-binding ribbon-helix-helix protein